jgi:hypothetical protein
MQRSEHVKAKKYSPGLLAQFETGFNQSFSFGFNDLIHRSTPAHQAGLFAAVIH